MSKALELAKFGRETPPVGVVVGDSDTQTLSGKTFSDSPVLSSGIVDGVAYLNGSKGLTTSSNLTFNGTLLTVSDIRDSSLTAGRITYAGVAGNLVDSAALTFDGTAITLGGSAPRLLSNMSGTQSTRFAIQNSTANGNTRVFLYPNGTGTISAVNGTNNSDPSAVNFQAFDLAVIGTTDVRLSSNATGSATPLPLTFYTNGFEQMRLTNTGLGIGTNSPAVRLHVASSTGNGVVRIDSAGGTSQADLTFGAFGFAAVAGVRFEDSNTLLRMYADAARSIAFNTNGFERARIDSSGRLGVGTNSPAHRIHVVGSGEDQAEVQSQNTSTAGNSRGSMRVRSATSTFGGGLMMTNGTDSAYPISSLCLYNYDNQALVFGTNNTERARIDSSGRLMVGRTTSPRGERLVVDSNGGDVAYNSVFMNSSASSTVYSATTWTHGEVGTALGYVGVGGSAVGNTSFRSSFVVGTQNSNPLVFNTTDTERMRITSSGNVGVGTNAPAYRMVVQDSLGETILGLNNTSANGRHYLLISGGSTGSYAGGRFGLYSVTNGVDLLAATTSTASTAGGTTGNGVGFSNAGFWVDRGWGDYPSITVCNNNYSGNSNQTQLRIHGTNATWASYPSGSGGDFSCSLFIDGTYQSGSDRRYKTNITVIENAIDKVLSMTGKRFQTINSLGEVETGFSQNSFRFGFIAQDLQAAGLDELYKHNIDEDDGTDGFNKAYSVEYDAIVPVLVNAIKEQQDIINSLKARLDAANL